MLHQETNRSREGWAKLLSTQGEAYLSFSSNLKKQRKDGHHGRGCYNKANPSALNGKPPGSILGKHASRHKGLCRSLEKPLDATHFLWISRRHDASLIWFTNEILDRDELFKRTTNWEHKSAAAVAATTWQQYCSKRQHTRRSNQTTGWCASGYEVESPTNSITHTLRQYYDIRPMRLIGQHIASNQHYFFAWLLTGRLMEALPHDY